MVGIVVHARPFDTGGLIEHLGLRPKARTPLTLLSVGQERRLALAVPLIRGTPLLVLDEPTRRVAGGLLGRIVAHTISPADSSGGHGPG